MKKSQLHSMTRTPRTGLRIFSLILTAAFAVQEAAWAAPVVSVSMSAPTSIPEVGFRIPESVAMIEDGWKAPAGSKTVFLIQDAHTNESGQMNMAKTLDIMIPAEGISTVYTEGADQDVSLAFLKEFFSKEAIHDASLKFVRRGLMKGSEFANLNFDHAFRIEGVEDPALYDEAGEKFAGILERRAHASAYLDRIARTAATIKESVYSDELQQLDADCAAYADGQKGIADHFKTLSAAGAKVGVYLPAYEHLSFLKKIQKMEDGIDFDRASSDQAAAIKSLSADVQKELTDASKQKHSPFKLGGKEQPAEQAFFALLKEKLASVPDADKNFPELFRYLAYLDEAKKVDAVGVIDEIRALEEEIFGRMTRTQDEKFLYILSGSVRSLRNLLEIKMTPQEYARFQSHPAAFDVKMITGFFNRKIMDLGKHYDQAILLEKDYQEAVRVASEFYELTYRRDEAFVNRMIGKMDAKGESKAVLVTGGYHTPNLKRMLQDRGISYVSILPQVLHETDMARYRKLVLKQLANHRKEIRLASAGGSADTYLNEYGLRDGVTAADSTAGSFARTAASIDLSSPEAALAAIDSARMAAAGDPGTDLPAIIRASGWSLPDPAREAAEIAALQKEAQNRSLPVILTALKIAKEFPESDLLPTEILKTGDVQKVSPAQVADFLYFRQKYERIFGEMPPVGQVAIWMKRVHSVGSADVRVSRKERSGDARDYWNVLEDERIKDSVISDLFVILNSIEELMQEFGFQGSEGEVGGIADVLTMENLLSMAETAGDIDKAYDAIRQSFELQLETRLKRSGRQRQLFEAIKDEMQLEGQVNEDFIRDQIARLNEIDKGRPRNRRENRPWRGGGSRMGLLDQRFVQVGFAIANSPFSDKLEAIRTAYKRAEYPAASALLTELRQQVNQAAGLGAIVPVGLVSTLDMLQYEIDVLRFDVKPSVRLKNALSGPGAFISAREADKLKRIVADDPAEMDNVAGAILVSVEQHQANRPISPSWILSIGKTHSITPYQVGDALEFAHAPSAVSGVLREIKQSASAGIVDRSLPIAEQNVLRDKYWATLAVLNREKQEEAFDDIRKIRQFIDDAGSGSGFLSVQKILTLKELIGDLDGAFEVMTAILSRPQGKFSAYHRVLRRLQQADSRNGRYRGGLTFDVEEMLDGPVDPDFEDLGEDEPVDPSAPDLNRPGARMSAGNQDLLPVLVNLPKDEQVEIEKMLNSRQTNLPAVIQVIKIIDEFPDDPTDDGKRRVPTVILSDMERHETSPGMMADFMYFQEQYKKAFPKKTVPTTDQIAVWTKLIYGIDAVDPTLSAQDRAVESMRLWTKASLAAQEKAIDDLHRVLDKLNELNQDYGDAKGVTDLLTMDFFLALVDRVGTIKAAGSALRKALKVERREDVVLVSNVQLYLNRLSAQRGKDGLAIVIDPKGLIDSPVNPKAADSDVTADANEPTQAERVTAALDLSEALAALSGLAGRHGSIQTEDLDAYLVALFDAQPETPVKQLTLLMNDGPIEVDAIREGSGEIRIQRADEIGTQIRTIDANQVRLIQQQIREGKSRNRIDAMNQVMKSVDEIRASFEAFGQTKLDFDLHVRYPLALMFGDLQTERDSLRALYQARILAGMIRNYVANNPNLASHLKIHFPDADLRAMEQSQFAEPAFKVLTKVVADFQGLVTTDEPTPADVTLRYVVGQKAGEESETFLQNQIRDDFGPYQYYTVIAANTRSIHTEGTPAYATGVTDAIKVLSQGRSGSEEVRQFWNPNTYVDGALYQDIRHHYTTADDVDATAFTESVKGRIAQLKTIRLNIFMVPIDMILNAARMAATNIERSA